MKLEVGLTPVGSGGDRRRPGGGAGSGGCGGSGCGGGLIPGEVVTSVVSLTQWTPPPMVEGILAWWQPVLILDARVSVCRQHLHTKTAWKHLDWPGKVLSHFFLFSSALKCKSSQAIFICMAHFKQHKLTQIALQPRQTV